MRRVLRRSLCLLGVALAAFVATEAMAETTQPIRLAAVSKHRLTPKERAAEAERKRKEARAKLAHIWIIGRDGGRPSLLYARSNGDDVKISLSCQSEGLVRIIVYDVPAKGMRSGDGGRVRLSNGPARIEVAATAIPNEKNSHAMDLGGITKVSPRLFSLLKTGDTMVVEVPGRTTGVSLKTIGPKIDAFERSCR
jgi:hypothetical protein